MSKAGTRRKSRELALQMLFQLDMGHQEPEQVRRTFWSERQDLDEKVREFADDVRDGKFILPIGRRMPLRDAAEAQVLGEKGGIGKIILLAPDSKE